jgi:hypothetical protein
MRRLWIAPPVSVDFMLAKDTMLIILVRRAMGLMLVWLESDVASDLTLPSDSTLLRRDSTLVRRGGRVFDRGSEPETEGATLLETLEPSSLVMLPWSSSSESRGESWIAG